MIVLKAQLFLDGAQDLAKFVNVNKIKKEDILAITEEPDHKYTLFYYADSESQEIMRGFFGW